MTDRHEPVPGSTPPAGASPEGEDLSATRLRRVLDLPRPALGVLADFELEGSRTGFGSAPCHHGELFQGADIDPATGRQRVILTTMRTPWTGSHASFVPEEGGELTVDPPDKKKALRAARQALAAIGCERWGGALSVRSFTEEGRGFGTSSSDCIATVRAVCDAFHAWLKGPEVARILFEAEGASDPLMFDQDVLFCSRQGHVLEDFGGMLPPVHFVGFDVDPSGAGVVTEACPHPSYDVGELESFRPMIGALRHAVYHQDPVLLGRVASASTRVNQRYLPKPELDGIFAAADEAGSLGVSVAHTGTLVTILFDARGAAFERGMDAAERALARLGFGPFWRSNVGR